MNKTDIARAMSEKMGSTIADSKKALDAFLSVMTESLMKGETVNLTGFATFSVKERAEREGVNPFTKEKIKIEARKVVKFKAGEELEDKVRFGE